MIDKIVLSNQESGDKLELNKDGTGNFILDDEGIDWGSIGTSIYTYKSPKQIGNEVSGVDVESRTVIITGWLYGTQNQIEKKQFWLGNFVVPGQAMRISVNGYYIEGYPQKTPVFSSKVKENNEYMCKFVITLYCGKPEFTKENAVVVEYGSVSGAFRFPFHFVQNGEGVVFGVKEIETVRKVTNEGIHDVGGIITLKCNGESLSNPKIFNIYSPDEFIVINKTMQFGEEIHIDTRHNNQDVIGVVDGKESNYFKYWDFENTWLQFKRGDNYYAITYEGIAGILEATIEIDNVYYVIEGM